MSGLTLPVIESVVKSQLKTPQRKRSNQPAQTARYIHPDQPDRVCFCLSLDKKRVMLELGLSRRRPKHTTGIIAARLPAVAKLSRKRLGQRYPSMVEDGDRDS